MRLPRFSLSEISLSLSRAKQLAITLSNFNFSWLSQLKKGKNEQPGVP